MTTPISSSTSGSSVASAAATSMNNTLNQDTFLKLLVAQLQNQDPMNPTDGTQFLTQTAQFTEVSSLQSIETANAQLLSTQQAMTGTSMIGKQISYTNSSGTTATGVVSSAAFGSSGVTLTVGSDQVPLANVISVSQAPASSSTSTSTTSS
jgi:flagellar basal-body rod modification protein FlgD